MEPKDCELRHFHTSVDEDLSRPIVRHEHSGCSDFQCGCIYVHMLIYAYNALLYIYWLCMCVCVCVNMCMRMRVCVKTTESTLESCNVLYNIAQNIWHIHTFLKMCCFRPWQFKRQCGCSRVLHAFSGLISMLVFDIL